MKLWMILFLSTSQLLAQSANPDLPNPELLTRKYLEELSQREIGQKRFVVKSHSWMEQQQQQQQQQPQSDGARQIQEADIYKIGRKDKKELFLLNNHRGFQVVSFKDGLERPELIGRLPIYNNWSSEMYYLEKQDRVLIVNTEWTYSRNYWNTNYSTSVYVLDVANASEPKLLHETKVPGYLEHSRLVGDVLYTVTNDGSWGNNAKAAITSLKLETNSIQQIDEQQLHSENRWVRTMNVVQSGKNYYVMTSLSNWNGSDFVSVHDITSTNGQIKKLFTAKARGSISERSNTFIHKDHLFAVSNYQSEQNIMRISVEAFPMKATEQVIESKPEMRVSVGDTNGLHASLQDVRVSGDHLYAFWVPANNIDPFELFDISNPSKGIKHLGQLQFDGWISKAIPLEHEGRKFVLGLGWVVPATSEDNQRYPQAKLFEIKKTSSGIKHEVVTSLTIKSERFWSDLNQEDKYFEILQENPGKFNILFPVTFMDNWKTGAKILNLDLNDKSMSEGASVTGDQGWLRRVFLNQEIRGVHAFNDMALETFDQNEISHSGIARTVSVLELARDVVDFHVLNDHEGLQIIRAKDKVELRKVDLMDSDAEKNETYGHMEVKGEYAWHKVMGTKLYVITASYKKSERNYYWDRKFDHATMNVLDLKTGRKTAERIDVTKESDYFYFSVQNISSEKQEIFTIAGQMFVLEGNALKKVSIAEECQYFFDNKNYSFDLKSLDKEIYAYNSFEVKPKDAGLPTQGAHTYSFPFYKKLAFENGKVSCSESVNVPGKPVMITKDVVVSSEYGDYGYGYGYEHGQIQEDKAIRFSFVPQREYTPSRTYALKPSGKELEVTDILNKVITDSVMGTNLITFEEKEARLDVWSVNQEGQFVSRPQYLNYEDHENVSLVTIQRLDGRNFIFMKNKRLMDVYELKGARLNRLPVTSTHDSKLNDGSAENVYDMNSVKISPDHSRFFISQGLFGMTDIILK